jgi:GT2 family glycosyltransferase
MKPILSILIPTRRRPVELDLCLSEISTQRSQLNDFPIEIIVSEDSLDQSSKSVVTCHPKACWTQGPERGPAANRNHAATKASGKWLLFLDDDIIPQTGFLQAYAVVIRRDDNDALEGRMICSDERNSPFYRMAENRAGGNLFTANLAVRRETFEELGGFDEELIIMEDLEFAHRLKAAGKQISFLKEATVDHPAQHFGWSYIWRWIFHFRWGLLLGYKTGKKSPRRSLCSALIAVTRDHLMLMARKTIHLLTQHNPKSWANAWFWQTWGWLTLPLTLPHLWCWEIRYRSEFRNHPNQTGDVETQTKSADHILDA